MICLYRLFVLPFILAVTIYSPGKPIPLNLSTTFNKPIRHHPQIPADTCEYQTDGSGKSRGLKLKIKYPCWYNKHEYNHPYIIQIFESNEEWMTFSVLLNQFEKIETIDTSSLTENYLKEVVANLSPNSTFINFEKDFNINALPAALVDCRVQVAGTRNSYQRYYFAIYQNYYVGMRFIVAQKNWESDKQLKKIFDKSKSFFQAIVQSLVIL